jgi:hypothetical protein
MKQLKQKPLGQMSATPSLAKEIAQEFVRISKLTENGKDDEAWRAANALYKKYPNEATPNFIIVLILVENKQKSDALP